MSVPYSGGILYVTRSKSLREAFDQLMSFLTMKSTINLKIINHDMALSFFLVALKSAIIKCPDSVLIYSILTFPTFGRLNAAILFLCLVIGDKSGKYRR